MHEIGHTQNGQQLLRERASLLRYTCISYLVDFLSLVVTLQDSHYSSELPILGTLVVDVFP